MPCPSSIYCISNTGVPLYNDSYEDTLTNYNGVQYYTGQTNGLFIFYSSGDTQWCLSDTLGGTCFLSGKSPCSTTCPDLCDELFTTGGCPTPTPTPTNNCNSLDFAALFDCDLPLTPSVTPTMTVTPTVTVTPTSSSLCPVSFIDATIYSVSPTPTSTPTMTPTPSVMVERDCTFSGAVTYDMINDDIICPFSYEFQDCFDRGIKYYTFDTLENPSGGEISQFEVFNATVNGKNKCIHYVGFNNQISGTDSITLLTGPYGLSSEGKCILCDVINTPTPTPTQTVTPTITLTPTVTKTPTVTPSITPTITPTPTSTGIAGLACSGTTKAGGSEVYDAYITLSPAGGIITMMFYTGSARDKLEIYHGLPLIGGINKVATSSMDANGNYGPFDNVYGTEPSNTKPIGNAITATTQFIGTSNGGVVPQRRIQYSADTGVNIPTMSYPNPETPGAPYQQVVWWTYTSADYLANPIVTIRVTGSGISTTGWAFYRLCVVQSSINLGVANCKTQGGAAVRIPVTVSNAPVGYYVSMTVISQTNATVTYFGNNVTYTDTNSVGSSATIKLDLYDTFGGLILDSTTQTITQQPSWSSLPNC